MNLINYQDSRPIYEQITERYKLLILKGVLAPDEQMPSVRKLAMELSTNPNTVQRAYMELEKQGFLYSVRGKGSFVRGGSDIHLRKRAELAERLGSILKEAEDLGIDPSELLAECGWKGDRRK
ncbi:MAG: GntR family transcriptional regulator [Sarcina sp.]|nr:GntR family transcriptional regulator [Sarcina sp.]